MNKFTNNDFLIYDSHIGKNKIKCITMPNIGINEKLSDYVCKFINLQTFPYINSNYGVIINDYFNELTESQKIEIIGQLEDLLKNIDVQKERVFQKLSKQQIEELYCIEISEELSFESKKNLYSSVRGGEYGEMLVNAMFIKLGFSKIISKLYIQWGDLSPTGIDVPYIDLNHKELVLGEVKLYKKIKDALKSVKKDITDIVKGDKLDKELREWKKRVNSMSDDVKEWYVQNYKKFDLVSKQYYLENYKIFIVAVVIGDSQKKEEIYEYIREIFDDEEEFNFEIIILVVPIISKDEFIMECEKCILNLWKYAGDCDE